MRSLLGQVGLQFPESPSTRSLYQVHEVPAECGDHLEVYEGLALVVGEAVGTLSVEHTPRPGAQKGLDCMEFWKSEVQTIIGTMQGIARGCSHRRDYRDSL